MEPKWRGISFEGGGIAGLAHVGVIKVLSDNTILPQLTHISGSSAGSIIATLVACRLSYETIKEISINIDYNLFEDSSWFIIKDIYELINNFGWNSGDAISKIFGDILEKHISNRLITFGEIREKYGTTLIITSTDINTESIVYYTPDSHPDMVVIDAVRQSSSIPLFYNPVLKDDHLYVDGGVLVNYPIQVLYNYLNKEQVFGVKLLSDDDFSNKPYKLPTNITDYIMKIIKILLNQAAKVHIDDDDWKRTIKVNIGSIKATDFSLSSEQKLWLIDQGQKAALNFFT